MNPLESSLRSGVQIARPEPKNRGGDIFNRALGEYNYLRTQLKPDQSINLVCLIQGAIFDVYQVTANPDFYQISAKDDDGDIHIITMPVEQVAFDIIISKKVNNDPPREVGFAAIEKEHQKKPQ
jgi:hypothetical protein